MRQTDDIAPLVDIEDAEPVIEAFLTEAYRQEYRGDLGEWGPAHEGSARDFYLQMAARIEAGYAVRTPGEEVAV